MNTEIKNIAIIGLGLLGSSLGMALKDKGYHRLGWTRRKEVREAEKARGVIDETSDQVEDVLAKADLTVLCLPIPQIIEFAKKYAEHWQKGSIVTDIGSVKEAIVIQAEPALAAKGVIFIGSHPMAGTEKSGPESAFPELYNNAPIFVTPTENTPDAKLEKLKDFWKSINTRPQVIDMKEHDVLVGHTSHVSHLLALALTHAVLDCDDKAKALRYAGCASGFRDTSRITSSNPKMWREIIENNQSAVLETVKSFEARWTNIRRMIQDKDFDALEAKFAKGKELRDDWMEKRYGKN